MTAPLQLTFPELVPLRTVTDWSDLATVVPEIDVERACAGLEAWSVLDEGFGDAAGAAAHRHLAGLLRDVDRVGVPEAFEANARSMRAHAPADVTPALERIDVGLAECLNGDVSGGVRAAAAWVELAAGGALTGLPDPQRISLLCDGVALHGIAYAVTGDETHADHRRALLKHTLQAFRTFNSFPSVCRVHIDPRLSRISGSCGIAQKNAELVNATVAITHAGAPDQAVWTFEAVALIHRTTGADDGEDLIAGVVAAEPPASRLAQRARDWLIDAGLRRLDAHAPSSLESAGHVNDLAAQLLARFERYGDWADLQRAVGLLERIELNDLPAAAAAGTLGNLTRALLTRGNLSNTAADLAKAAEVADRAVALSASEPDAVRCAALAVRATVRYDRFQRNQDPADLDTAITDWRDALTSGPRQHRALTRYNLGNALLKRDELMPGDLIETMHLLSCAVLGLSRPSGDAALAANRLAEAAQRRAMRADVVDPREMQRAIRWGARAVAWARETSAEILLRVAWDAGMRAEVNKDWVLTATMYTAVVDAVGGLVGVNRLSPGIDAWLAQGFGAPTRAAAAWIRAGRADRAVLVLERGRGLLLRVALDLVPGSEDGPTLAAVVGAVGQPFLYLVPARGSGFAVLLDPGDPEVPKVVDLPRLTETDLGGVVAEFHRAAAEAATGVRAWRLALDRTLVWLAEALAPVLDVLPDSPLAVVPTGALCFLPVHVAFGDRVVSMAPTAATLATARARAARSETDRLLVVADPRPSALAPLQFAAAEAGVAAAYAHESVVLSGPDASVEHVAAQLSGYTMLHLACHATAEVADPRRSRLTLADDQALDVGTLAALDMDSLRLVVLSACETGVPGVAAPDETLTLGTAFFGAGAEGVVSSLWQVADLPTLVLVTCFYGFLADHLSPAAALHHAQAVLRDMTRAQLESHLRALLTAGRLPADTFKFVVDELSKRGDASAKPLSAPDYWAAFVFTGC